MEKFLEGIENLFVTKRKEPTYKKGVLTLILVIIAGFSMPIYFRYENYVYGKYKQEYDFVKEAVQKYNKEYDHYPIGDLIDWNQEKDLNLFFTENKFSRSSNLHYLDMNLIDDLSNMKIKYTYIVDVRAGNLYTSEFVVYNLRRWHFAFY